MQVKKYYEIIINSNQINTVKFTASALVNVNVLRGIAFLLLFYQKAGEILILVFIYVMQFHNLHITRLH